MSPYQDCKEGVYTMSMKGIALEMRIVIVKYISQILFTKLFTYAHPPAMDMSVLPIIMLSLDFSVSW